MIIVINIAKAIISDGQNVLMLMKEYENGQTLYTLPGGRQTPGESLEKTVSRHVREELATYVNVGGLIGVYEHSHPSRHERDLILHHVEFAFLCELTEPYNPVMGPAPGPHQVSVEWVPRHALSKLTLHPEPLERVLKSVRLPDPPVYLGELA